MKFSFARGALALIAALSLASCGGDKATFPINVNVTNVLYSGLILSTNGQDVAVAPPADPTQSVDVVFPQELEYGQTYDVIPKGQTTNSDGTVTLGANPKHQNCSVSTTYPYNLPTSGTAGLLAKIQIYYVCYINTYALTGTVKGLKNTGLVLANGSTASSIAVTPASTTDGTTTTYTGADVALTMASVAYNTTYGVTVLTQPTGQTCTVTGGANGYGAGTMDDTAEAAGGVTNLVVTCVDNPT